MYSVTCKFEPQMDSEGKIKILCHMCDVQITPGLQKHWLFNVRWHFIDSRCHKSKVISLAGRDNVLSESVVNLDMGEGKKMALLNKISPGTFELKGSYVTCSFCVGNNCTINLNPNQGSFKTTCAVIFNRSSILPQLTVKTRHARFFLWHKVRFVHCPNIKQMK